jgi:hypothetical protein
MQRLATNRFKVARRDVRIACSVWRIRLTMRRVLPEYKYHQHTRLSLPIGKDKAYTRFTARYMGYITREHATDCVMRRDRMLRKNRIAHVKRYTEYGGYLIVSYTKSGSVLCPDCAAVNRIDHADDPIVDTTTIDNVTDGWEPGDPEYQPAFCDGCNVDMGSL